MLFDVFFIFIFLFSHENVRNFTIVYFRRSIYTRVIKIIIYILIHIHTVSIRFQIENSITKDKMPARKKTSGGGGNTSDASKYGDDAYREKRQRNNDAVKKTRQKSKETATERKRNVERLKNDNIKLEASIKQVKENVETLKSLLLGNVKKEEHEAFLQKILDEPTDDEDDSKDGT